jgi:hypothetical protein
VDVYIGEAETEVRPVDTRDLRNEERLVDAVLARLEQRKRDMKRAEDDTKLCNSVRVGTGR